MDHSKGVCRSVALLPLVAMALAFTVGCNKQSQHAPDVWAVVNGKELKLDLRRQLSIQKLLNREVVAKISITDQEVTDFYNANKAQFNVAESTYHLAQIKVTPRKDPQIRNRKNNDATNEAEALRKIKMLTDRLNSGADFAQLAMDYSEDMNTASTGGDLGYVPESGLNAPQVDPALKRAVLALKPGQVSQPIEARDQAGEIGRAHV